MNEAFLQYIWNTHQFDLNHLTLSDGRAFQILRFGKFNATDSGPDFLHGSIQVDGLTFVGHIEIHIKSADWDQHKHNQDTAYDNVILHVVWEDDRYITNRSGQAIPTFILKNRIPEGIYKQYLILMRDNSPVHCHGLHPLSVPAERWNIWKERLLIERLQRKARSISLMPAGDIRDWDQILFISICKAMGMKVNGEAMEHLAQLIPLNILRKNAGDHTFSEALFFGTAGLLSTPPGDQYQHELQTQWHFIRHKYELSQMQKVEWKYARMHPPNFPDIRIAQLANLYCAHQSFLQSFLSNPELNHIRSFFENIILNEYWSHHFRLGHPASKAIPKKPGRDTIDVLIMNAIVPVLFIYSYTHQNADLQEKIISLLEQMPPENNKIIRDWKNIGIIAKHAADSQALLQLRNEYCDLRRCLQCSIGHCLLHK